MSFRVVAGRMVAVLLLSGALGACQPLPRPFAPDRSGGVKPLPAVPVTLARVALLPVAGLTPGADSRLRERLQAALARHGVPAVPDGADALGLRLQGTSFGEFDPVPALQWRLIGADGDLVGEGTVPLPADPAAWEDARIDRAIGPMAAGIARAVDLASGDAAPPLAIVLEGVRGAGPVGDRALARAMAEAIGGADVALATAPGAGTFAVSGEVVVGPTRGAVQEVQILWSVLAPDGRRLGIVRQANTVPAGSLDRTWVATARVVALAAVEDVVGLARQAALAGRAR